MPLPRGDQYNDAVQNPKTNFSDNDLQNCKVETTPLGLPKPYAGGFTTTYKLQNSHSKWAVRCFTREIGELEKRYQVINAFVSKNTTTCHYLVDAKFLKQGIKVNGTFVPIIKMQWLDGEPLGNYLSKNYNQKSKIESLIKEFENIINQLEIYKIAHGDLQHGNIMVKNDKLFLIDYDGMYFPELSTLKVNELGHPNFQHPKRTPNDYNQTIDRFSAIIIYTALKAIAIDPNLWNKYDNGDNLLFKGIDFVNPSQSALLTDLSNNQSLKQFANNIIAVSTWEFNKVPLLADFIKNTYTVPNNITISTQQVRNAYPIIDGTNKEELLKHIGQRVEVRGKIAKSHKDYTRNLDTYLFFNFGRFPNQTFTIVLWSNILSQLQNPDSYLDKLVAVTGVLGTYNGNPQIAIDDIKQIQIISKNTTIVQQTTIQNKTQAIPLTIPKTQIMTSSNAGTLNTLYKNHPTVSKQATPTYNPPPPSSSKPSSSYPINPTNNQNTTTGNKPSKTESNNGCFLVVLFIVIIALIAYLTKSAWVTVISSFVVFYAYHFIFGKK